QHSALIIIKNHLYRHNVLHVNFTTYDLHRDHDSLNPHTHADIMVLSHETEENPHPYWYTRIIAIFHLEVHYNGPELNNCSTRRIDVLWVHWFTHDKNFKAGWSVKHLPQVGFIHKMTSPMHLDLLIQTTLCRLSISSLLIILDAQKISYPPQLLAINQRMTKIGSGTIVKGRPR
ncbi:hypothetical protein M404DRAFT_160169, partial [Pisolithus tinctorius Marx 270]